MTDANGRKVGEIQENIIEDRSLSVHTYVRTHARKRMYVCMYVCMSAFFRYGENPEDL